LTEGNGNGALTAKDFRTDQEVRWCPGCGDYAILAALQSFMPELGKVTKSTPMGSLDFPFNPISLAVGAEATFVARAIDTDKKGMTEVLRAAAEHRGSAFVEIFQNCPIFNDDAFDYVRDDKEGVNRIILRHAEPITWGKEGEKALRQRPDGTIEVCGADEDGVLVHDRTHEEPALAFALSRVTQSTHGGTPVGIFRNVDRGVYDDLMAEQLAAAEEKKGKGDLAALLHSGETWVVS
jgi:2-oxoglutarate ferredoxin oxidoreductase subunit beta